MRRRLLVAVVAAVVLVSCSSGKKGASPGPTSILVQTTTSSTLPATPVVARLLTPEKASVVPGGGRGLVVTLVFTATDPAVLPADVRLPGGASSTGTPKTGHNPAFPGLVVALSTTGAALGGPTANLANLFQTVSPAKQADDSLQVSAVWTNTQTGFGADTDATLVAFTVAGTAPDTIPASPSELNTISNPAQVTFHLGAGDAAATGGGLGPSTSTTAAGQTSTTRAATTTSRPPTATTVPTTTVRPATTTTVPRTTTTGLLGGLLPGT